jgi:D-galactose 1-dehydrogenase
MSTKPIQLALVGIGKIAEAEHLPALENDPDWEIAALVSRIPREANVPVYSTIEEALEAAPQIEAISLATPPQPRLQQAVAAIRAGKHVMLEKPPGATLGEVKMLSQVADLHGVALFASWHSRQAASVEPARKWLQNRDVLAVEIVWREDIRQWHPGQDWILEAGGMGVFDPGINAISILTAILPRPLAVRWAQLDVPRGRQGPIAAQLELQDGSGMPVSMTLDFLYPGEPRWDIIVRCADATLRLERGGATMWIDDQQPQLEEQRALSGEYPALYRRFASLIKSRRSDVDITPLLHVADAMLLGERREVASFNW